MKIAQFYLLLALIVFVATQVLPERTATFDYSPVQITWPIASDWRR